MYTWYAVVDSQNVCHTGCHFPSQNEWLEFINYLGVYWAVLPLKQRHSEHWVFIPGWYYKLDYPSRVLVKSKDDGIKEVEVPYTDFNAIGDGYRSSTGGFYGKNATGEWWTSSEFYSS